MTVFHLTKIIRWVSVLASIAGGATASATIYYAAPGAPDNGAGTTSAPVSIYKARSLAPGDTLYLMSGNYVLPTQVTNNGNTGPLYPHVGTLGNTVKILRDPDPVRSPTKPVIDGSLISLTFNNGNGGHNTVSLADYTEFGEIDLINGVDNNLATWGCSHIYIHDVTSSGAYQAGILIGGSSRGSQNSPGTEDILVDNCVVTNCSRKNVNRNASSYNPSLMVYQAHNVTISNCQVYQTYGEGIGFRTVTNSTISGCSVTDSYSAGIYMDNAAWITISSTSTYASNSNYYRNGHPAIGLLMAVEPMPYVNGVQETGIGCHHITDTSTNDWKGSPGREFYRYTYDTWSDVDSPTTTCSFNSTPTGLDGFPAILNINQ